MWIKKFIDFRLIGLTGAVLLVISEFLPWFPSFSEFSLLEMYIYFTKVKIGNAFLYLFPFVSGIICLIGSILIIYNNEYKINSVIITFIGLGFLLYFFFNLIPSEFHYLSNIGIGFYFCITGFFLSLLDVIIILITKE